MTSLIIVRQRMETTMSSRKMRLSAKVLVFSLALMIVLTGCEGMYSPRAPKDQDELAKKFEPEPKSAVIYVYRPTALEFPRAIFLYNDGDFVASPGGRYWLVQGGSFVRLVVTPGTYVIGTKSPSARSLQNTLVVVADAGKLYYAEVSYQARGVTGDSPKLRQVDEGAAQKEIRGYDLLSIGPLR